MTQVKEKKDILRRIEDIDRRIIYAIIIFLIILPILMPQLIKVPIAITKSTTDFYAEIQKLKPGDTVLYIMDASKIYDEQGPIALACLKLLFKMKISFVLVHFAVGGPVYTFTMAIPRIPKSYMADMPYGERWVDLGYVAGVETGMAAFSRNTYMVVKDYYGTPVEQIPIMKNLKSYNDFQLLIFSNVEAPHVSRQFWSVNRDIPIIGIWHAARIPVSAPFYSSGQIKGAVQSTTGGAEFEALIGEPGLSTAYMSAVATTNYFVLGLVVLGNLILLIRKLGGKK